MVSIGRLARRARGRAGRAAAPRPRMGARGGGGVRARLYPGAFRARGLGHPLRGTRGSRRRAPRHWGRRVAGDPPRGDPCGSPRRPTPPARRAGTRHGRAGVGVLSLVSGTGAYNWLRVKPTLGSEENARRLGRSAILELAVGAAVIAVTAVLVATPPPIESGGMDGRAGANWWPRNRPNGDARKRGRRGIHPVVEAQEERAAASAAPPRLSCCPARAGRRVSSAAGATTSGWPRSSTPPASG